MIQIWKSDTNSSDLFVFLAVFLSAIINCICIIFNPLYAFSCIFLIFLVFSWIFLVIYFILFCFFLFLFLFCLILFGVGSAQIWWFHSLWDPCKCFNSFCIINQVHLGKYFHISCTSTYHPLKKGSHIYHTETNAESQNIPCPCLKEIPMLFRNLFIEWK